jgi:N-acylneuraminate cytidylyltransferase
MAFIPARAGSKSVVHKNIKLLKNHPLIAYSIRAALLTSGIDRVIVSTDSEEYAGISKEYGAEVPFIRPAKFAQDESGDFDWISHALGWFKKKEGISPRLIVHLRPTTPLRQPQVIEKALKTIESNLDATALRSVHGMSQTAYKCFEKDGDYLTCISSGIRDIESTNRVRQSFPKTYEPNGYVDILKTDFFLKHNKVHGDRVIAFQTNRVSDVDTLEDFNYLEYQVNQNIKLYNELFN